jgi:mRNA-degrading endonuclease RelE of RelBE toxin-antitoxin system
VTFLIADTFTDSLGRLTAEEQKAAKTTAFDLQMNPASPGLSFHKLDKARDKRFWSVRVSADLRLIVHRDEASFMLCYVDHHDRAYDWAERRRIEVHPKTGAAQIVEVRETVKEIVVPVYVHGRPEASGLLPVAVGPIFAGVSDDDLLGYGVPPEWLPDVRAARSQEAVLGLVDHLPGEAAEALLELATGGKPTSPQPVLAGASAFAHPDAQRRFRVVENVEELQRALEFPWDKWTVFLHPEQRGLVERNFSGPARVAGSAGTGKTIVALHRAASVARRNPESRVLLTTYSDTLADALRIRLVRLISQEPRLGERIDVHSLNAIALRLYRLHVGDIRLFERQRLVDLMRVASAAVPGHRFSLAFLVAEWEHVVDAWQLPDWPAYREFVRLGRKSRLSEAQRQTLWDIFSRVRSSLHADGLSTRAEMYTTLAGALSKPQRRAFDHVVVDEAQDLGVAQLRFLAALGGGGPNALFLAGDLGQRIFQQPFSWKVLGVDVRGRSRTLRVNYRTSHQIRAQADRLLGPSLTDMDGVTEERRDTVSVFNGPAPMIQVLGSVEEESRAVGEWLAERAKQSLAPHEFGVFVRSRAQIERATAALCAAGLPFKVLDDHVATTSGFASVGTMHLAKGLEFRAVAVMACDDEIIPLQERIEEVGDDGDLREVYETERQLLYVACTRARDHLLVTGVEPASEFLDDLRA